MQEAPLTHSSPRGICAQRPRPGQFCCLLRNLREITREADTPTPSSLSLPLHLTGPFSCGPLPTQEWKAQAQGGPPDQAPGTSLYPGWGAWRNAEGRAAPPQAPSKQPYPPWASTGASDGKHKALLWVGAVWSVGPLDSRKPHRVGGESTTPKTASPPWCPTQGLGACGGWSRSSRVSPARRDALGLGFVICKMDTTLLVLYRQRW